MVFLTTVLTACFRMTVWLALKISPTVWFYKPKAPPNTLRSRYDQKLYAQNSLRSTRKAENSHEHFSKRQKTKAPVISVTIFALLVLATTAPVSKAVTIVANANRAKTSSPNKSTICLVPFLAFYSYKGRYITCSSRFEWSQDHHKPYHWVVGNCLFDFQRT